MQPADDPYVVEPSLNDEPSTTAATDVRFADARPTSVPARVVGGRWDGARVDRTPAQASPSSWTERRTMPAVRSKEVPRSTDAT